MGCGSSSATKATKPKPNTQRNSGGNTRPPGTQSINITAGTFITRKGGSVVNEYVLMDKLGSGSFGDVYKVKHKSTGQYRALKKIRRAMLHPDQLGSKQMLKEVELLKSLDHPNILRMYEMFEDNRFYYVVTELCEGGELFDAIVKLKIFTENQAAEILMQLLSAIAYCHDLKIIHRDLKPENILLEGNIEQSLNIRIADFGNSCMLDARRQATGKFGSAYYMSPEMFQHVYNEKCDVWSCGVIMYILLTGKAPYRGRDENAIMQMIQSAPLQVKRETVPNISAEALDLLQSMLKLNTRERISAASALYHPWIQQNRNQPHSVNLNQQLNNMRAFVGSNKLKEAVYTFITTQIVSTEEIAQLKETFQSIDINGDGKLSREELVSTFSHGLGAERANQEVNRIMEQVDSDNSGYIDYTEFLKACTNWERNLSLRNLEKAFQVFDVDQSGTITADELRHVLGQDLNVEERFWKEIIEQVDQNGDGQIDIREFSELMHKKIS